MSATESSTHMENLETFALLWLDEHVNETEENRQVQQKLRSIINYLKTFEDENQCQQYILSTSSQDRIVLIVSGQLGRQLVPQIHQLPQLSSIYVYCMNKELNEQWTKDFIKVKDVIITLDELVTRIKFDEKSRMKIEEPILINIFTLTNNPDQSTTELNGDFLHSLLLIDVLLRMKSIEKDKQDLIALWYDEYKDNKSQLKILRKFEREYSSDEPLIWYTYDSFIHKILNKALRVQNLDILIPFRFFITDIYRQLQQHQCQSPIQVYRCQVMSTDELNNLRQSIGKLISINSFLSTSLRRHKALEFLHDQKLSADLHRVLFVIDADPSVVTTKPFADISSFSEFAEEAEVLFMIACIFRLIDIHQDDHHIWIIQMKLCGDDDHHLKTLYEHIKNEYSIDDKEVNLLSFAEVLYHMGKFHLAEKIYCRLLNELPSDDPSLFKLYYFLGMIAYKKEDYDLSLQWYNKSLAKLKETYPSNYINIGDLYNCIGEGYRGKNDYDRALEWHNKGIELYKQAHDENHSTMALLYNNIGLIYEGQKKYCEALDFHQKALAINIQNLPSHHSDIAKSHHNIAIAHDYLGQYDLAMKHYNQSLEIKLKSLPSNHPSIAKSYQCMGCLHYDRSEWKEALTCFQKAANIYNHSLSPQHPTVIRIKHNIERAVSKLK